MMGAEDPWLLLFLVIVDMLELLFVWLPLLLLDVDDEDEDDSRHRKTPMTVCCTQCDWRWVLNSPAPLLVRERP